MQETITIEKIFNNLSQSAPEVLSRKKIQELTGGLVAEKTLANLDSEGEGIQPRLRMNGKVAYPKEAVISWLKSRCKMEGGN